MKAEDVWADFDELMDVQSVCPNFSIANHSNLVRKVSIACAQQVINVLHHLKYQVDDEDKPIEIESIYDEWNELYHNLLKL